MKSINLKTLLSGLSLALVLGSSSLFAQSDASATEPKRSVKQFVLGAHEGGQLEVQLAQLGVDRASNSEVRSFAQGLVIAHQQVNGELSLLVNSLNIIIAPEGSAASTNSAMPSASTVSSGPTVVERTTLGSKWVDLKNDRKYSKLTEKSGAEFDREFLEAMVDEHKNAVDLFEKASRNQDDSQVQAFASKHLPKLREHLAQAEQLQRSTR